jgi:hypothetical protein
MCGDPLPATVALNEWVGTGSPASAGNQSKTLQTSPHDGARSRRSRERSLLEDNNRISAD